MLRYLADKNKYDSEKERKASRLRETEPYRERRKGEERGREGERRREIKGDYTYLMACMA
jgi:hypothetical protein